MFQIICDQFIFAPLALSCFFIGLSILELKSSTEIYDEWRHKMPKTWLVGMINVMKYMIKDMLGIRPRFINLTLHMISSIILFQAGACIWPFLQSFNWKFVPLRNQVVYISICAFFWTTLMAYFKSQKITLEQ